MTIYLICMCLVSLGIGYILAFTEATLRIGKSLSDVDTPRGYQDAITPPQLPLFGFGFNIIFICGLIYGFWIFGWLAALGAIVASIFVGGLSKAIILPKSESEHFHKLIIHSLLNRYAN